MDKKERRGFERLKG